MSESPAATDLDPQEVVRAENTWHRFTQVMKYAIIVIAVGVAGLAWITL